MSFISNRGKTIRTLINELHSFENQDLDVKISFDCGESSMSIGLVGNINNECVLMNCENEEYFFGSLHLFQTDSVTQYFGQPRDYRIGYLMGQGIAFLVIAGVIVWLIIRKLRK